MEHSHNPHAIRDRIEEGPKTSYLSDWVYGGIDGAITTFAIVAGVVGADLSTRVILILGAANIIADGFSMAASNYSGTKAELDDYRRHRAYEEEQVETIPEGERMEIREIFRAKGFSGDDLERVVDVITADKTRWVDTMMVEEYGMPTTYRDPVKSGMCTFAAFILCGLAPLIPFFFSFPNPFETAIALTGLVFFGIGSIKSQWSTQSWLRSGIETLGIGLAAAAIAWGIGHVLKSAFL
jgi:VIT1/CCC1 family predicted Fe2+/Mn2+ transporter